MGRYWRWRFEMVVFGLLVVFVVLPFVVRQWSHNVDVRMAERDDDR